jgi:hypothetical protein
MADCNDNLQKPEVIDDPNSIQLDHPGSENLEESRLVHLESLEVSQPVQPEDRPAKICYREWSPLVKLLSQIPTRIHRNIVGYDLVTQIIRSSNSFLNLVY